LSYVVLARKYRPLRFADMVGQEHIGRTLGNAITQDRVHHAYLFAGARGLGKTTTARIFAKALVCERGPSPEPCNACEQCISVTEGRSVDVIEIDGASNNSVENIRSLREQVNYLPQTARRKVYIIDEVHMLTTSAFNALLKTLEEPPAHVNFVFATTEPHKVLATILSRVSRLDFRRVSIAETVAHLEDILRREELGVDAAGLRMVARAAGGSVRDAMTLLDQVLAFAADPKHVTETEARAVLGQAERTAVSGLVDAVLARDPDLVLERFDALAAAGHDLTVLSLQMLEDLRDLTVARACRNREMFVDATADELEELTRRAAAVDVATLAQTFDRLWRVIDRLPMARSQRLVLEMGLLGLAQREPLVPLGDLIERLGALGEGGAGGGGGSGRAPARGTERAAPRPAAPARRAAPEAGEAASFEPTMPTFEPTTPTFAPATPTFEPTTPTFEPTTPTFEPTPRSSEPAPFEPALAPFESHPTPTPIAVAPEPPPREPEPPRASEPPRAVPSPATVDTPFARGLWELAQRNGVIGSNHGRDAAPGRDDDVPHAATLDDTAMPASRPATNGASAPRTNGHAAASPSASGAATTTTLASGGTPITPPPPVDDTHDDDDVADAESFAAWSLLVASVNERDQRSALLSDLGLVQYANGVLRVAATRGSFAHAGLVAGDLRSLVEQVARELNDGPVSLELVDDEPRLPDRPSLGLVHRRRRARLEARVAAEAREHPTITALLRDFDAKIASTRPMRE